MLFYAFSPAYRLHVNQRLRAAAGRPRAPQPIDGPVVDQPETSGADTAMPPPGSAWMAAADVATLALAAGLVASIAVSLVRAHRRTDALLAARARRFARSGHARELTPLP